MEQPIELSGETILVVPCYNEAARLDLAEFQAFAAENSGLRFLFVNDGSTDDTAAVLRKLSESRPETFLVHELPHNCGKAEAVRVGILRAIELQTAYVGFMHTCLSAFYLLNFLIELREYDDEYNGTKRKNNESKENDIRRRAEFECRMHLLKK